MVSIMVIFRLGASSLHGFLASELIVGTVRFYLVGTFYSPGDFKSPGE